MKNLKVEINEKWKLIILFFGAIMAGSVFLNMLVPYLTAMLDVFSVHKISMEPLLSTEWERLFIHVFCTRSFQLLLVLGVLFWVKKPWILYVVFAVLGGFFGMTISAETMMLGWIGVLYAVLAWFPHYVFYVLILSLAITMLRENGQYAKMNFSHNFIRILVMIAFLGLGCLLETTINPQILHWCHQYLVDIM